MLASLLLAGCATKPAAPPPRPSQDAAAQVMERAQATSLPARRAELYLQALLLYHQRGDADAARDVLRRLSPPAGGEPLAAKLPDAKRFELRAVMLELALAAADQAEAERLADALQPTSAAQQAVAERLRTKVLMAARNHAAAALELMAAAPRQVDAAEVERSAFAKAIWRHLSKLPPTALRRLAANASAPVAAWLNLARELNTALTSHQQAAIWQRWTSANGGHPAAGLPPPGIATPGRAPKNIALLIPLSGDIGAAAEAIREGFLAAYLRSAATRADDSQGIRIYDTGTMTVAEAYRRAVADGAELVVGPLEKAAVAEMTALSPSLPVVALNTLNDRQREGVYQIGLAVEDDAAAIAAALSAEGVERVVVFEGQRRWSSRAMERFDAELAGTEVVAVGRLDGIAKAAEVAGEALGIADSSERRMELAQLLGEELEFVPRRRDDVDAVVAFLDGAQLTALKPALDFHYAGDLPVFAPSQAVQGVSWQRLEGLRVCDIPWRLHRAPLRQEASAFAAGGSAFFALGVDAFRIANQLPRMTDYDETLAGATGMLTLGKDGRIHRQLAWGKVVGGRLVAAPTP